MITTMELKHNPVEWENDQDMDVLFSPFRENRDVNPRSWDSKMTFWTNMILKHCSSYKILVVNAKQIPHMFERKGKLPVCMNVVLEDLLRRRVLQRLSDYTATAEAGWLSWSVDMLVKKPVKWGFSALVKKPLSWAFGQVFGGDDGAERPLTQSELLNRLPDEQYVIVDLVKKSADAIYLRHSESVRCQLTDNVIGYADLLRRCADISADEQSFHVAILELCRRKLCTIGTSPDGEKIIRMVSGKTEIASPLSEHDMQIYRLKTASSKLEDSIAEVTKQIEQCRVSAKQCLQQGKKQMALKLLRKKKQLEATQKQKEQAIDKIQDLIAIIEQTESHKQVLDAYSSGVQAFKEIKQRYGLNEDTIDDTMLNIQEAFDINEQINQSISTPMDDHLNISEDELENELDALLAAKVMLSEVPSEPTRSRVPDRRGDQSIDDILHLPAVPTHSPGGASVQFNTSDQFTELEQTPVKAAQKTARVTLFQS